MNSIRPNPKMLDSDVFVSRNLHRDSPIRHVCSEYSLKLQDQSLLSFCPIPFEIEPKTEWLFFYSRKGVEYFSKQYTSLVDYKTACMASGTARAFQETFHIQPHFIGTGRPQETALLFSKKIEKSSKKIGFVQAKQSRRSVQSHLGNDSNQYNIVVYDNKISSDIHAVRTKYAILTSPMNVQAFQKTMVDAPLYSICIGQPTAKACKKLLPSNTEILIAESPSESGLAKTLESVLKRLKNETILSKN